MKLLVILLVCSIVVSGSYLWAKAGSNVVLPGDVNIVAPDENVPKELAGFSGKWFGSWYGVRTGSFMFDHVLVVERVFPPYATVVFAGAANPRWGILDWTGRLTAEFKNRELVVRYIVGWSSDTVISYRLSDDGSTLSGTLTNSKGQLTSTLKRIVDK